LVNLREFVEFDGRIELPELFGTTGQHLIFSLDRRSAKLAIAGQILWAQGTINVVCDLLAIFGIGEAQWSLFKKSADLVALFDIRLK